MKTARARLLVAFAAAFAFYFAAQPASAQVPDAWTEKASARVLERSAAGRPQDLIVVFDSQSVQKQAAAMQSLTALPSSHPAIIAYKATRYAETKRQIMAPFAASDVELLQDYGHLPMAFVRVHNQQALARLLASPCVLRVYQNRLERKTLAQSLPLIGQPQAAASGYTGAGTTVAVLDTGVDYTRPAFGSCTSPGVPAGCKVIFFQHFEPNPVSLDPDGHGTNVAGIVLGVAPGTRIAALDVFNGSTASSSDILAAGDWVIAHKAAYNIVAMNLSLGSGQYTAPETNGPYNSLVDSARAAGILTIASAGNDGYTNALSSPGATAGVVSVGAVYDSAFGTISFPSVPCTDVSAADKVACFSNSASFLTLLAPGSQITAAELTYSGTSQAAPHVAGAVAVLRAAYPAETLDQTVARLTRGVSITDSRNGIVKPRLSLPLALGLAATSSTAAVTDVRTYVPAAAASGGYRSYLRIINTGSAATPISVAAIDGSTGVVGPSGQLLASLPAGAAATFTAQQVETALGTTLSAADRPRIRVSASAATSIATQSFLLQPGGVFNEVSAAQSGASVAVPTYVPAAAAPAGYVSCIRVINTGTSASPVTVARIDPVTGQTGAQGTLTAALPAGAAVTYTANQLEAALGVAIAADERPRLLVSAAQSTVDVQAFLLQPGGAYTDISSSQNGSSVDVRSYVPAAAVGYTSYLRVINGSDTATPVTASLIDGVTGAVTATGTLITSLAGNAAMFLSSKQVEAALGLALPADDRPRIRVSSATANLDVQSFLLQPGGAFDELSGAASGTSVLVRTYVPAADAATGYSSYLRVINTGSAATPVTVALVDAATGMQGTPGTLIPSLPAGAAQTFSSYQVEAALGAPIAAGLRPRIQVSGNATLEVQSFLSQPGGTITEMSGGQ